MDGVLNRVKSKAVTAKSKEVTLITKEIASSKEIDRANNVKQREEAAYKAGITREKYLKHVAESLEAMKVEEKIVDGRIVKEEVADKAQRNWAVEQCREIFGDKHSAVVAGGGGGTTSLSALIIAQVRATVQRGSKGQ